LPAVSEQKFLSKADRPRFFCLCVRSDGEGSDDELEEKQEWNSRKACAAFLDSLSGLQRHIS
jgi:hypothetical protein